MCNCTSGYDEIGSPTKSLPNKFFFIIFVDWIFTTLLEWPFTKLFDVTAQTTAIPCVCRPCNAD
jgi:hypothetical protein